MGDAVKANIPATMAVVNDLRKNYQAAWNRLFDLVQERNKLLKTLSTMAQFAGGFTPDTSMFFEFDFDRAQDILAKVQAMKPRSTRPLMS
jgi:hypothetical protein